MELTNAHNSDVSPHTTLFMVIFENEFEDFSFPIIFLQFVCSSCHQSDSSRVMETLMYHTILAKMVFIVKVYIEL